MLICWWYSQKRSAVVLCCFYRYVTIETQSFVGMEVLYMEQKLYTINEVAEILRLSKSHVYTMVRQGLIRVQRFGKKAVRVPAEEVERLLKSNT